MKIIKNKLQRLRRPKEPGAPGRITNETVAEYREKVLAGGRRFKYPMQYARRRLVITTLLISLVSLLFIVMVFWWQLYLVQSTSKLTYRAAQLVPAPVAKIDGQLVRYSDYLMQLRSGLFYLAKEDAVNFSTQDGKRQLGYQKRVALNKVEDNTYVAKLAKERGITVSNQELNAFIDQQLTSRKPPVTRQAYEQVLRDFYDWSFNEYRASVRSQLLRSKVALAIDIAAKKKAEDILGQLKNGADFTALAKSLSDDDTTKQNGGDVGFVPKNSSDPDGLITAAAKMQPGQISDVIQTRNGYYIIKLIESRPDAVRYARIFVALRQLDSQLQQLRSSGKVKEYISVPKDVGTTRQ